MFDQFVPFFVYVSFFSLITLFFVIKNTKIFLDFNILFDLHMDLTLTCHYSKFQTEFKELSINFDT